MGFSDPVVLRNGAVLLTYTHSSLPQPRDKFFTEAGAFQRPCLIDHVEEMLPVVPDHVAFIVYYDGRVVVLRVCWPLVGDVYFLWVSNNHMAVMF